jgi:hypothetical protein
MGPYHVSRYYRVYCADTAILGTTDNSWYNEILDAN